MICFDIVFIKLLIYDENMLLFYLKINFIKFNCLNIIIFFIIVLVKVSFEFVGCWFEVL